MSTGNAQIKVIKNLFNGLSPDADGGVCPRKSKTRAAAKCV